MNVLLLHTATTVEYYKYHQLKNKESRLERGGDVELNTIEADKGKMFLAKEGCCGLYEYASRVWKTDIRKTDAFLSALKLKFSILESSKCS